MFPLLLVIAGLVGAAGGVVLCRKFPALFSLIGEAGSDAYGLLNFPTFTVEPGKPTTLIYLAPAGVSPDMVRVALISTLGSVDAAQILQAGIPIPTFANGLFPAFADVWTVHSERGLRAGGLPSSIINPMVITNHILRRHGLPLSPVGGDAARQLTELFYKNALASSIGLAIPEFIPIAGRQS